jgi:hypothetical protein
MTANFDPSKGWVRLGDIPEPKYPPFLVEDLIHEGPTVLYGRPKAGKSYLALSLAVSLMTETPWLGSKVREQRRVAYWGLDPVQTGETKRRANEIPGLNNLMFCSLPPGPEPAEWRSHSADLERIGIDYLIIDNLTRLMPGKSVRDDDLVTPVLTNIDFMTRAGIGVLLIHHAGKPGEDGNPKTSPLGATAIEAWGRHFLRADAVKDRNTGEVSRTLHSYGNDLSVPEKIIPFVIGSEGVSVGENRDFAKTDELMTRIISGGPWTTQRHIADELGVSQPTVQRTLKKCGYKLNRGQLVPTGEIAAQPVDS